MDRLIQSPKYWLLPVVAWAVVVFGSFAGNWIALGNYAERLALERGRSLFTLVEMARLWNSQHGGVYVPVTAETKPNPYLEVPDRDVVTTEGVLLTKINPAFMTRMISEVARENSGIRFNLTSLELLNPNNAPDAWERSALEAFSSGSTELLTQGGDSMNPTYRYMARLLVKKECLGCHERQGYRVGDVRGGISVTLAAQPILAVQAAAKRNVAAVHLGAYLLLAGSTVYLFSRLRRQWRALRDTKERLEERERFATRLTESMGEACVAVDAGGRITFANEEATRLLGWPKEDWIGRPIVDRLRLHAPNGSPQDAIAEMLRSGKAFHGDDVAYQHRDGHTFAAEHVGTPLVAGETIVGGVVLFRDITLRKQLEAALVRSETMFALGKTVAGVAHEINTPLGIAVTAASHLAEKTGPLTASFEAGHMKKSELAEYLATARQSSSFILGNLERAAQLIRSFKLVAADRASESRSRFELPRYLEDVLTTLRPMLERAGHTIELDCAEPISMNSFPGAFSQVITNLVVNSHVHGYAPGEKGHLCFRLRREGHAMLLSYSDDGSGIPPEIAGRIFDPFFTTKRQEGSTGLGLHISHNLVTQVLKGTLEFEMGLHRGAKFALWLPLDPP